MNFFEVDNIQVCNDHNEHEAGEIAGVTVLIPLYNGVEYLEQSVKSVVNQTYKKWQLIIGINGHDEGSDIEKHAQNIINDLKNGAYDILVKSYDTKGKAPTLNKMVEDAKYDHIAILDVDDYWVAEKLELQVPYLKVYDVVGGKCEYFGDKSGSPTIPIGEFSSRHNIFEYNPVINSSVIIRKKDAIWDDEHYVPAVAGLDDYSLWFKLFYLKRKFYNLDKVLCHHRVHVESAFNYNCVDNVPELKRLWHEYYKSHSN